MIKEKNNVFTSVFPLEEFLFTTLVACPFVFLFSAVYICHRSRPKQTIMPTFNYINKYATPNYHMHRSILSIPVKKVHRMPLPNTDTTLFILHNYIVVDFAKW
jgi:hypothetical protein